MQFEKPFDFVLIDINTRLENKYVLLRMLNVFYILFQTINEIKSD